MDAKARVAFGGLALGFNPRARDGREWRKSCRNGCSDCFNPRARDGRENVATGKAANNVFQSTRP